MLSKKVLCEGVYVEKGRMCLAMSCVDEFVTALRKIYTDL